MGLLFFTRTLPSERSHLVWLGNISFFRDDSLFVGELNSVETQATELVMGNG